MCIALQLSTAQASIAEPSPEELKRKQLASQIFGGLSGPSRAPRTRQQRKSPSSDTSVSSGKSQFHAQSGGVRTTPKKAKEPQVDLLLDLQDIDFSQPSVQTQQTATSTGGLLDNLEVRTPQQVENTTSSSTAVSASAR